MVPPKVEKEETRKDDYTKGKLLREDQKGLKDFGERNRKMKIFLLQPWVWSVRREKGYVFYRSAQ